MDIASVFGALASGAGGGIIGGIFGLGKKFMADRHEAKMMKIQQTERAADRNHDLALADKEIKREHQAGEMKLEQAMFQADSEALVTASSNQDKAIPGLETVLGKAGPKMIAFASFLFVCATFCQKMVRIVLTVALVWQTFEMFQVLNTTLGGLTALDKADQVEIWKRIIYSIISLTGMAVAFWYCARPEKANRSH